MFSWPDPHQTRVQCPGSHITTVNIFAFYIHFQCCVLKSKRWMLIALLKILVLLKCNGKMLFVVCLTIPLIKDLVYTVNINDFLHVPSSVEKINHNALNWKKNKQNKKSWLTHLSSYSGRLGMMFEHMFRVFMIRLQEGVGGDVSRSNRFAWCDKSMCATTSTKGILNQFWHMWNAVLNI